MEHFNGILFHKSGPANKQHTNQPNPVTAFKSTEKIQGLTKFEIYNQMSFYGKSSDATSTFIIILFEIN